MTSDIKIYCQNMEEIKKRISVICSFLDSGHSFGHENFDYEVVCLHLRKILELIAFSSLTANKEEYSKVHKDFTEKWNAKKLINSIERINPGFYPKPVKLSGTSGKGIKHLENIETGFLDKEDWLKLYDLCSKVLHVWNPYSEKEKNLNFEKSVTEWGSVSKTY